MEGYSGWSAPSLLAELVGAGDSDFLQGVWTLMIIGDISRCRKQNGYEDGIG